MKDRNIQSSQKAVLTIATGKPVYVRMAINLARSFKLWHKGSPIRFTLVTDQKHLLPEDLSDINVIEIEPGSYGQGFSTKLHLDSFAPAEQTLFVDADCLCVGSLETVFERFAGRAVSVVGGTISEGEWFGDVAAICRRFGVASLPKFNGGVYYLEKGEQGRRVYETARELEPLYDDLGLSRLRGRPNDELLMAIAMAVHGETPIPDDGSILSDPQACPGAMHVDVIRGESRLINPPPPAPQHREWYPFTNVSPILVHFLGYHTSAYPYRREELILKLVSARKWAVPFARAYATLARSLPLEGTRLARDLLRPVYRQMFGVRSVSISDRV
jgi:hypothetical protein